MARNNIASAVTGWHAYGVSTSFLGDAKLELLRSTSHKYCLAWHIAIQADGEPRRVGGFRGWMVGGFRKSVGGFREWVCTPACLSRLCLQFGKGHLQITQKYKNNPINNCHQLPTSLLFGHSYLTCTPGGFWFRGFWFQTSCDNKH